MAKYSRKTEREYPKTKGAIPSGRFFIIVLVITTGGTPLGEPAIADLKVLKRYEDYNCPNWILTG